MNDRDGQHDFDFEFGHWKIHNRRLLHPLSGSNDWVEFDGTVVAQPIWDGRANMDVFEADSPTGHLEGMTFRTYNTTIASMEPLLGDLKNRRVFASGNGGQV